MAYALVVGDVCKNGHIYLTLKFACDPEIASVPHVPPGKPPPIEVGEVRDLWNTGQKKHLSYFPASGHSLLLSGCEYCICGQQCCLLTRRIYVDLKKFKHFFCFCGIKVKYFEIV